MIMNFYMVIKIIPYHDFLTEFTVESGPPGPSGSDVKKKRISHLTDRF